MPDRKYMAQGWSGTEGRPTLQEDLLRMADDTPETRARLEENTQQNMQALQQGERPRRLPDRLADEIMQNFRSPRQRIRQLQARAAELRMRAQEVERSGTGNWRAAQTYRQAADILLERIPAITSMEEPQG